MRHSRGTEPTAAGLTLAAHARSVFRLLHQARADVAASNSVVSGTLRIGYPPSIGNLLIGSTVAAYHEEYPDVRLQLHEGYSHVLRDSLLGDRLDLALMTGRDANPLLVSTLLWLLEPRRAASKGKRSQKETVGLDDVADRDLIQPSRANTMRQLIEARVSETGATLNVVMEAEALPLIKDLVRRGVDSTVCPYSGVSSEIESGELVGSSMRDILVSRYLTHRIDRPVSLAFARFTDLLLSQLRNIESETRGAIRLAETFARERSAVAGSGFTSPTG